MNPSLLRPSRRRAALASAAVLVGALVSGCGGHGDGAGGGEDSSAAVLTSAQAKQAVLSLGNMGAGWKVDPDDDDDDDDDTLGCLGKLDTEFEAEDAEAEAEGNYVVTGDFGLPAVSSQVGSYKSGHDVSERMDALREALDGCDTIKETDKDGTEVSLKLKVDEEKSHKAVDEQVNLTATGTIKSSGMELPMALSMAVARVNNNVALVIHTDLAESASDAADALTEAAVQRLVDVVAGEEPSEDAIEGIGPGGDDSDADSEGEGSAGPSATNMLPFDGGSYTWASGVKMTLSVEKVEPWGDTDDFCGDGSCGIANPKDTRFVLKYTVTVPPDFNGVFDPSSCPGELHVNTGNDDEAFSGVAGDYDKELGGKIMPGATKFGVQEYYIEKAYAHEQFNLESTCGDKDFDGETAYFGGPIADIA